MINFDKLFKISSLFSLFLSVFSHSYAMDDEDFNKSHIGTTPTQEGLLPKDEKYLDYSMGFPYLSKDKFNQIFIKADRQNFHPLAAKLEISTRQEKEDASYVSGSGSVIWVDEKTNSFKVITNAHVAYDNYENEKPTPISNIDFSKADPSKVRYGVLKQAMLSKNDYIAGEIDEVCFSNKKRDLAVLHGKYNESKTLPYDSIQKMISFKNCSGIQEAMLYGHPNGVNKQRVRKGQIDCQNETHTISSLPGDSGGGAYSETGQYLGTHVGGNSKSFVRSDIKLEGSNNLIKEYKMNEFYVVSKENIDAEFTNCYSKTYKDK